MRVASTPQPLLSSSSHCLFRHPTQPNPVQLVSRPNLETFWLLVAEFPKLGCWNFGFEVDRGLQYHIRSSINNNNNDTIMILSTAVFFAQRFFVPAFSGGFLDAIPPAPSPPFRDRLHTQPTEYELCVRDVCP